MSFGLWRTWGTLICVVVIATAGEKCPSGVSDVECWSLQAHNKVRSYHGTPPLKIDRHLSELAHKCSEHYAELGAIDHSCTDKGDAGENLYTYKGRKDLKYTVLRSVRMWYGEIEMYDFTTHHFDPAIGHFTQVVWKNSTSLGVAVVKKGRRYYLTALYSPRGNLYDFEHMVLPLKKTVHMSSMEVDTKKPSGPGKEIITLSPT